MTIESATEQTQRELSITLLVWVYTQVKFLLKMEYKLKNFIHPILWAETPILLSISISSGLFISPIEYLKQMQISKEFEFEMLFNICIWC